MASVWFNGSIVDPSEAMVSALDRGLVWGHGLFETLRSYGGRLWAFDEHYARLSSGAEILDLVILDARALRAAMTQTIGSNGLEDCGVRVTITAGTGPVDPHAEASEPPNVLVTAWPLRDYSLLYESGATLITLAGGRALPGVKSISYAASLAGRISARRAGADDALFVGADGLVLESTGSNLLALFGDEIVTPPVADGVLPGVTRRCVLEVAREQGLRPREEGLWLDDLFTADEVLLTSTLREVYPAASIDGRRLSAAGAAGRLRTAFHEAVLKSFGS